MRVAVMGSGGIGGYYGARLAQAGVETHFVARGAHLDAMRTRGLAVLSPVGDVHLEHVLATDDPAAIGPVDCVLFATKLWDVAASAALARPLLGPETAVISLQNGVSAEDELAEIIGPQHVLGGVAEITSFIERPGVIAHKGDFARIRFGELDGSRSPRAEAIRAAFADAGIDTELSSDIIRLLWLKFILIVATSNLTALTRQTIGPIRGDPQTRAMLVRSLEETIAVGRAKGVALGDDALSDRLAFIDRLPNAMTTSMANDLDQGKRLELDWFAGHVVRLGAALGMPTPFNETVYGLLKLNIGGRPAA